MLFIQLLIISVIGVTIQGAPVKRNESECDPKIISDEAMNKTEKQRAYLYCIANTLQHIDGNISDAAKRIVNVPPPSTDDDTKMMLNITFNHHSYQCKNFTIALSLKHRLQDYLFHQTKTTAISQYYKPLCSILVYLQTMANLLDDIEFDKHNRRCIRLTPTEYKMMYHVIYGDILLLKSLQDMKDWVTYKNYEGGCLPAHRNCEILDLPINAC